ncbi:hypothetical protein SESBI_07918 [Sesbania bispinosa]|nr:hypothetical protein SESBI_07918 [Sesbania bispinosa]
MSGEERKDLEKHQAKLIKLPETTSGEKGKNLEKHQVKLIKLLEKHQEEKEKTWKSIRPNDETSRNNLRRKMKRPEKASGQMMKLTETTSGGKGKDLEKHQAN